MDSPEVNDPALVGAITVHRPEQLLRSACVTGPSLNALQPIYSPTDHPRHPKSKPVVIEVTVPYR